MMLRLKIFMGITFLVGDMGDRETWPSWVMGKTATFCPSDNESKPLWVFRTNVTGYSGSS